MILLTENDTRPLDVTLDVDGDIDGATIAFHMTQRYGDKAVTGSVTIVSAPNKQVRWTPGAGDLDTPGVYDGEWQISYTGGGGIESAPSVTEVIQVRPEVA